MSAFKFHTAEHSLHILDWNSTTFHSDHKFKIEALVASRFFVREFTWTGSGVEKERLPEVISDIDKWGFPYHRIHGPMLSEGAQRIFLVDLGRTLKPGETDVVQFKHKMKDLGGTFQPFFRVRPTSMISESLKFRISLPKWPGLKATYTCFEQGREEDTDGSLLDPIDEDGGNLVFEKLLINPSAEKMGHKVHWSHGRN